MLASRGATDLSEDCAQEALVRIGQRLADYRGQSRLTTWALSIATRVAFDELRHSRWKDLSLDAMTADARGPVSFEPQVDANQERSLVRQRVLDRLREVIERDLTDKQRLVLVAELNGTPHLEIAREMGTTRNALYKLSHDARRRVKRHLEASGISAADVLWVFE